MVMQTADSISFGPFPFTLRCLKDAVSIESLSTRQTWKIPGSFVATVVLSSAHLPNAKFSTTVLFGQDTLHIVIFDGKQPFIQSLPQDWLTAQPSFAYAFVIDQTVDLFSDQGYFYYDNPTKTWYFVLDVFLPLPHSFQITDSVAALLRIDGSLFVYQTALPYIYDFSVYHMRGVDVAAVGTNVFVIAESYRNTSRVLIHVDQKTAWYKTVLPNFNVVRLFQLPNHVAWLERDHATFLNPKNFSEYYINLPDRYAAFLPIQFKRQLAVCELSKNDENTAYVYVFSADKQLFYRQFQTNKRTEDMSISFINGNFIVDAESEKFIITPKQITKFGPEWELITFANQFVFYNRQTQTIQTSVPRLFNSKT